MKQATPRPAKVRLDVLLHESGLTDSRELARRLIMAGEALVDGRPVTKPGALVAPDASVSLKVRPRFVSRGGDKLAAALETFEIRPLEMVCADVGASTGGFTDCLLQAGAARVYAIDVGYGQLIWALRRDPRVIVLERVNARYLASLDEPVNLVTIDVSFISLTRILPVVKGWLTPAGQIVALVKPQFEAGKGQVGKGGVVRDPSVHRQVLAGLLHSVKTVDLTVCGLIASPLRGPSGNIEFLMWLRRQGSANPAVSQNLIEKAIVESQSLFQQKP